MSCVCIAFRHYVGALCSKKKKKSFDLLTSNKMTFLPQTLTDLRLLDSALLEGARAWVMGTVMSVFTPVTLVRTPHA